MKVLLLACCFCISLGSVARAQLTIDATGPTHVRHRQPTSGSAGSSGYKLPVKVAVETISAGSDDSGRALIEFSITNIGKQDLSIPVSPNAGDFEPEGPNVGYSVKMLNVYLTVDRGDKASRQRTLLPGGAHLYGSSTVPGTLVSLTPGESIHVLARVSLPGNGEDNNVAIVGRTSLNEETVKTVGGQTSSDLKEIGSGESQDYSVASLLRLYMP